MNESRPPSEPEAPAHVFAPVPGRARRDGWTPDRQARFIAALGQCGVVQEAARAVGMSRKSAYALRRRAGEDSAFAAAWGAALSDGEGVAFSLALDRCLEGEVRPVFYRGRQVGEWRRFDDRLLVAAMRAVSARERRGLNASSTRGS